MDTVTTFSKPEISQHDLKSGHNIWNMRLFKKNLNSMLDMHTDTLSIQKKQIMLKVPRKLRYKGYVSPLGCCAFNVLPQSAVQPVCSPAFTHQPAGTYVHEGRSEASGKLLRVYPTQEDADIYTGPRRTAVLVGGKGWQDSTGTDPTVPRPYPRRTMKGAIFKSQFSILKY